VFFIGLPIFVAVGVADVVVDVVVDVGVAMVLESLRGPIIAYSGHAS